MYWDFDLQKYYWNMVEILSDGEDGQKMMAYLNS